MALVVVSLDGGILEHPVHLPDLIVGPLMSWLGQAMVDAVLDISIFERVRSEALPGIHGVPHLGSG